MAPNEQKKETMQSLKRVEDILKLVTESMTRDEFVRSFEKVVNFVKKIKEANEIAIKKMEAKFSDKVDKLEVKSNSIIEESRTVIKKEMDKGFEEQNNTLNFMKDKARDLKDGEDGKDADEDLIVDTVLERIPTFEVPQETLDDIEFLLNENKKLTDEIEGLRKRGKLGGGGTSDASVRFSIGRVTKKETPSGLINGSNKVYTVGTTINAVMSFAIN